jgi:hypothetical protein
MNQLRSCNFFSSRMATGGLTIAFVFFLFSAAPVRAQQADKPAEPEAAPTPSAPAKSSPNAPKLVQPPHAFWDRENIVLFSAVGAARFLDYASTLNLRHRGLDEVFLNNQIVDNHPLFVGIELGGTAVSIGVSYLFHRTGHHELERWTSIIHFGLTVGGAARNYALKTPH